MPAILDRLLSHRALGDAPRAELEWLAARGQIRHVKAGEVASFKGVPVTVMMVVLAGHIVIRADRGAGAHKLIEWKGGDVGGLLPYSRGAVAPNDAMAEEDTEILDVEREHFPAMIRECPAITTKCVHVMLDRARAFTSGELRDEKLVSLGKLAAGLAHELNNPASAATRAARLLAESQVAADDAARRLGAARLSDPQLAALDTVRDACRAAERGRVLSGLERADREDALGDWLRAHLISDACAGPLAETAVTISQLDALAAAINGPALDAAMRWLAAGCAVRSLAGAIEASSARVSEIVHAVKGFTHMDQAPMAEPVDIRRGVTDTITMLAAKVRAKSAQVTVDFEPDLPDARAVGAEINQVWMNLIDNALDAIASGGSVRIRAHREFGHVFVEVEDNGAGIAPEMLPRIFEPFFTTKRVGEGTGLGLDIVRRLLHRQEGGIEAESAPGRTLFRTWLPAANATTEELRTAPVKRTSALLRKPGT